MSRNVIHMGHGPHSLQTPAGQQALPRALAGGALGDEIASSAPTGDADAKQPIDGLSRLRSLPVMTEISPICGREFAALEALLPAEDFRDLISLLLSDIALHLARIARLRAGRDFGPLAREAHSIVRIAGNLGATHVRVAAHRLESACQCGHYDMTYRLISQLAQACSDAEDELRKWLCKTVQAARA